MLTLVLLVPLAGIPFLLIPKLDDRFARLIGLAFSLITFVVSLGILFSFDGNASGFQLVQEATWVESLGFKYILGVDGISLFMVLITTFLMPLAILASWKVDKQVRYFMGSFLVLETALLGTFMSLDLLLFFLFFEAMLFPMYLIIGAWGGDRRVYAAVKFFLYTMFGSAFLFVAILFLYFRAGSELGQGTFDLRVLQDLPLAAATARWLFLAFFVAFAIKVPMFPLHTWLPDAHTEAPTAGSVILAAILLKIGAYGLLRFNLSLFPDASRYFADFVQILALIGIIYGAAVALMQTDIKRLVAYSSVSHLGFVVLGIFAFTEISVSGGVLQMVNHGLSTGALFLLVGMLYERTHTRELGELGGLASVTPVLAGLFLFVSLSSLGLPGLNNFVGEFLVILGTFSENAVFGSIAAVGVVLAAIYLLTAYQKAMQGPVNPKQSGLQDLSKREIAVIAPVAAAILVIGILPNLLLDRINPTTTEVVRTMRSQVTAVSAEGEP
ncbi:MAG: NADH-quinone oxidoreductase subunit M [Actinomycetota bacterium]